jgi:hypothetical protein
VTTRQSQMVATAFIGGLVFGAVVWSAQMRRSRRELFSRNPVRRFAALGHLGGHPGIHTARILAEYVGWERNSALRRRGERLLNRMHSNLD